MKEQEKNKNGSWEPHEVVSPWVRPCAGISEEHPLRSSTGQLEVGCVTRHPRVESLVCLWVSLFDTGGDNGTTDCFLIWSGPFTPKEMWVTSLVVTRVKARKSLIPPHSPRINDKWHFPFVIFGIFVDLFGGFCWIPRNGLWPRPILPISTLHLWNPSAERLPSFRALTPAWQGAADTKKAGVDEKGEVGYFYFFPEAGGGGGWNGRTVGVNPSQLRDFSTWKLLFHINSQAKK